MPVVSVGEVNRLIGSGDLDGRVAAVRGYWIQSIIPSCPAPNRWYSPLEGYCTIQFFSDVPYAGAECHEIQQGTACNGNAPPVGAQTIPIRLVESGARDALPVTDFRHFDPLPVIVIGHAGDPRYVQCNADVKADCRTAFVADSIAWANGKRLDTELGGDSTFLKPSLTIDQVAQIVGSPIVNARVVQARGAQEVDPRLHFVGDQNVWVVRALDGQVDGETQAGTVMAIDDSGGAVLATAPLALEAGYSPALLRTQGSDPRDCCGGSAVTLPFFRVTDAAGNGVVEGEVGGGFTSGPPDGGTRWYPSGPVALDPGRYELEGWEAQIAAGQDWGTSDNVCTMLLTLTAGQELRLEAAFSAQGECTWGQPTFADSLY